MLNMTEGLEDNINLFHINICQIGMNYINKLIYIRIIIIKHNILITTKTP
ncbi:hypothetical protein XBJ2_40003 [Xenorhabdus bovienii str. Jollieti]|nr:hypothetical protein XBJ2_40003 [Xenorhabdus bovienii str. Jollieti]